MPKVVVVGSSNTDMVFTTPKMPLPGETVIGTSFEVIPGGKGANQAVAAARAGAGVVFIAKVGQDDLGEAALEGYRKDGIDVRHISRAPSVSSGVAMIMVDSYSGENSIVVAPGANALLTPGDIEGVREELKEAGALLVQLETPLETVQRALELARVYGVKTILNPAPAQALSPDFMRLIDYITPNETETQLLTGILPGKEVERQQASSRLLEQVGHVVITLGSQGAYMATKGGKGRILAAPQVKPVDTTAAGDVFNGYLAAAIAEGKALEEAIQMAIHAASVSVTRKGAQPSIPFAGDLS